MAQSAQFLATKALKAIYKSLANAVQYDDVPDELLHGENICLNRWTLIVSDATLRRLSPQPLKEFYIVDPSTATVRDMFHHFWNKSSSPLGITSFSISGAKEVGDMGIALVARHNANIRTLDITSCSKISDNGMREVGLNCTQLQTLRMSGCHGIEGTGLISIAECCRNLSSLDVSGCRALQRWSLAKVFYYCTKIEYVNLSNMRDVGDDEVRVLAQNCPFLLTFIAKETPCVSDNSIQSIAQYCPDIDLIDVSRTQMTFRISDVSLLALGERSKSLRELRVSGCDSISDVGLTWLAAGCQALEVLDLNGCNKLTDAGMRPLGASCRALKYLDISQAKLVSDIGITTLSTGCKNLRHLYFRGLYLLSDPRLSAPKKGESLEAWQTVIGIAALTMNCPNIETLDLSGCFRLNISLQEHIATLSELRCLNLTGCNQSSSESLIALSKKCTKLEELNLSDCGKSITSAVVASFCNHCPKLRVLTLCRCEGVKAGAIRGIANCASLEKLDLTGCQSITDIMMLPLTEIDKVPLLRTLILVGLTHITDSTLAWISSKSSNNIVLLALKGTSISRKSLQAVRDRFPQSDLLQNDNFTGFWPRNRVDDRKLMNGYHRMTVGLTKLQARVRARIAKKMVATIEARRKVARSILLLQTFVRMFRARREFAKRKAKLLRLENAALKITSIFWMVIARSRVRERRAYLRQLYRIQCAKLIQLRWRIHRDQNILEKLRLEYLDWINRREFGATKMQSIARVFFAKRRIVRIKEYRKMLYNLHNKKAKFIQRVYRGFLGRKLAKKARIIYERHTKMRVISAIKIQRKFRIFRTHKIVKLSASLRRLRLISSIKIQSAMRGFLARLYVTELRIDELERREYEAVIKIQALWRTKLARMEFRRRMAERAKETKRRICAAIVLQKHARAQHARRVLARLRDEYRASLRRRAEIEILSVVKIQALFRGMKGRLRCDQLIRERKGKWKELYDEQKKRRFFYNKLTGEIRWRMPQDLLDLIPKPICDNCTTVEAMVECAVCNEVYCQQCFQQVHRGGRRKDHEFRSIFDYYGKRLDYGDGCFPCKWPTEVIQDEVQGWMLRVAPLREPTAVHATSSWEEYQEVDVHGKSTQVFYFNRNTFETTYDKPKEILDAENYHHTVGYDDYYNNNTNNSQYYGYYDEHGNWIQYDEHSQQYYVMDDQQVQQMQHYGNQHQYYDNNSNNYYHDNNYYDNNNSNNNNTNNHFAIEDSKSSSRRNNHSNNNSSRRQHSSHGNNNNNNNNNNNGNMSHRTSQSTSQLPPISSRNNSNSNGNNHSLSQSHNSSQFASQSDKLPQLNRSVSNNNISNNNNANNANYASNTTSNSSKKLKPELSKRGLPK